MKSSPPIRQKRGKPIRADLLRQLAQGIVRHISGSGVNVSSRGGSISIAAQRQPIRGAANLVIMRVETISNNYLTCLRIVDGVTVGDPISVLKHWDLLHDLSYYPQLTSLTTVDAQTVTASNGVITETWVVTPPYASGSIIMPSLIGDIGWTDGAGAAITWIDYGGRQWRVA